MQRSSLSPTKENIEMTLNEDILERNASVFELVNILDKIEGNYSVVIDGGWGSGKTFFIKQVQMVLEDFLAIKAGEDTVNQMETIMNRVSTVTDLSPQKRLVPVYFNAWQYDNQNDPLLSILFSIISSNKNMEKIVKNQKPIGDKVVAIADLLLLLPSMINLPTLKVSDVKEAFTSENILEEVNRLEDVKKKLKELVGELIRADKGKDEGKDEGKVIFFIDELDRCRPSYAIEVLERMKHFFDDDRIICVYATNMEQLTHSVSHAYGINMDATQYLNRFFDMRFELPLSPNAMGKFYTRLGINDMGDTLASITQSLIAHYQLSLRDCSIYLDIMTSVYNNTTEPKTRRYLDYLFVPFMEIVKIVDHNKSLSFLNGTGFDELHNVLENSTQFSDDINIIFDHVLRDERLQSGLEFTTENLKIIYLLIFNPDSNEVKDVKYATEPELIKIKDRYKKDRYIGYTNSK